MDKVEQEVDLTGATTSVETSYKHIQLDTSTNVARMTMNRPPYNVLTIDMMHEMSSAIEGLYDKYFRATVHDRW